MSNEGAMTEPIRDANGRAINVGDTVGFAPGTEPFLCRGGADARYTVEALHRDYFGNARDGAIYFGVDGWDSKPSAYVVIDPTPAAEPAEPAVLGVDRNGEQVFPGSFLGLGPYLAQVVDAKTVVVMRTENGFSGVEKDESPVAEWLRMFWTRARARELGYPAQEPAPETRRSEQGLAAPVLSDDREYECDDCGAAIDEEHTVSHKVSQQNLCVYCEHRINGMASLREGWFEKPPTPEPYEEHGAWETPGAES